MRLDLRIHAIEDKKAEPNKAKAYQHHLVFLAKLYNLLLHNPLLKNI